MNTVDAVYENGVFRPLENVALDDHQRVRLTIEPAEPAYASSWLSAVEAFQRQLIASHGLLPESTADIAADRRRHA
jgi:predicted DNA-binding antitoxin AbrB/MazE fold protein